MVDFVIDWALTVALILCESGPYLLVGFLVAGYLKVLVPEEKVFRYLGKENFRSVATASLVGVPMPLCSCSVLPTAAALKKSGASKGATTSFLIATPETGVDSIGVTWALMDPLMTVTRPFAALCTALGAGTAVSALARRGWDAPPKPSTSEKPHSHDHCHDHDHDHDHADGVLADPRVSKTRKAMTYAFGPLLDDLTPWFIVGFVVSGFIAVLIPDDFFGEIIPSGWLSMLAMLVIGIPIYICATASTPVAAALMAKGLDPGSALVLLLAGPATNLATMAVVSSFLGRRVLLVYVTCIAAFALLLGWIVNLIYDLAMLAPATAMTAAPEETFGPISVTAGVVLAALLWFSARRIALAESAAARVRAWCRPLGFDPLSGFAKVLTVFVLVALYMSTAVSVIGPGETGFVLRFGDVRQTLSEPGLYLHAPLPFERVERVQSERVRGVELGIQSMGNAADVRRRDIMAEQAVMTGEESILSITYTVHYRITNPYTFRFGIETPDVLVRALAETAIRKLFAQRASGSILVGDRNELQTGILELLQGEFDAVESGLEVTAVNLLDIHAPRQVHFAYRDVASALEDKERQMRQAEGFEKERLAQARAEAFRIEQEAMNEATNTLQQARGEAEAFAKRVRAYTAHPHLTRQRLRHESAARMLQDARLVVLLDQRVSVRLLQSTGNLVALPPPEPGANTAPGVTLPLVDDGQ